jgi:hypothetical protein
MKRHQAVPSRFFRAEDTKEDAIVATIDRMYQDKIGDEQKEKNILSFLDHDRELVLNGTNFDAIVEITGEADTDDWHGSKVVLLCARVDFGGKKVDAIRVASLRDLANLRARARKASSSNNDDGPWDDSVPFPSPAA